MGFAVILIASCKKKDDTSSTTATTTPPTIAIGQSYAGGVIAYILQSGDAGYVAGQVHGLIASTTDVSSGIQWYNGSGIKAGASGVAIGTGSANTTAIVNAQGTGSYAAQLCKSLTTCGYTDWYLPSKEELDTLYAHKSAIGGFTATCYWSSTEYNPSPSGNAWYYDIPISASSYNMYGNKANTYAVRAVRSF